MILKLYTSKEDCEQCRSIAEQLDSQGIKYELITLEGEE